jgi:hypothetical protein
MNSTITQPEKRFHVFRCQDRAANYVQIHAPRYRKLSPGGQRGTHVSVRLKIHIAYMSCSLSASTFLPRVTNPYNPSLVPSPRYLFTAGPFPAVRYKQRMVSVKKCQSGARTLWRSVKKRKHQTQ